MKDLIRKLHNAADALEALYREQARSVDSRTLVHAVRTSIAKGKEPHWTQTADGKRRMSRFSKRAWRKRKAAKS